MAVPDFFKQFLTFFIQEISNFPILSMRSYGGFQCGQNTIYYTILYTVIIKFGQLGHFGRNFPKNGRIRTVEFRLQKLAEIPPKKKVEFLLFWAKFRHFGGISAIFMAEYSTVRIRPKWPNFLTTVYYIHNLQKAKKID
jgi:hypothetical protein